MLAQRVKEKGYVTGLDLSKDLINYARNNNRRKSINFIAGDVNKLLFEDNSFDWTWSMDTVWLGPREFGCPAEDPFSIMEEFYRVIKPGGFVYLLLVYLFGTYFTYRIYRVTICKATQQQGVIIMQKIQLYIIYYHPGNSYFLQSGQACYSD